MVDTADLLDDRSVYTGAFFSECRRWRFNLWRYWDPQLVKKSRAVFVMMNPSTADEVDDDPTVKRCQERAMAWADMGFMEVGGVDVVNVFAWRETDSRKLTKRIAEGTNIVGPGNDDAILSVCKGAAIVVCGWGKPGHELLGRGPQVLKLLRDAGIKPYALQINGNGSPKHPLYIGYGVKPVPLEA